jgi:hypothetical protein
MKTPSSYRLLSAGATLALCLLFSPGRAQSYPPAYSGTTHYAVGDLAQETGNTYRCIKASVGNDPASSYSNWELSTVRSDTTLIVGPGQFFPTLTDAWNYALYCRVADGVYLHFYLSSTRGTFSESHTAPFLLDHGSGARIAILGDNTDNDVLSFNGTNGFIIDTGHSINTLTGFTLQNTSSKPASNVVGIKVNSQATITSLSSIQVSAFGTDLQVSQNGSVSGYSGVQLVNYYECACEADSNGTILLPSGITLFVTQGVALLAEGGQIIAPGSQLLSAGLNKQTGALAIHGGYIDLSAASISSCYAGAAAEYMGSVELSRATVSTCEIGVYASDRGFVNCGGAAITGSNDVDLSVNLGGLIDATAATYSTSAVDNNNFGSYIAS